MTCNNDHGDADGLLDMELSDGHALQCPCCREVVMKDWWLRASDAEILARNDLSTAARKTGGASVKSVGFALLNWVRRPVG